MQKLTPYLMFPGNCEAALHFYKTVLSGDINFITYYKNSPLPVPDVDNDKVMHAMFQFEGGVFMASDYVESVVYTADPEGSKVHMNIGFDKKEELEAVFNQLAEGGEIAMPLQNMFWGDRFGRVKDKFGVNWMFSGPA